MKIDVQENSRASDNALLVNAAKKYSCRELKGLRSQFEFHRRPGSYVSPG